MHTLSTAAPRLTTVVVQPDTPAGAHYRSGRETAALAAGFTPQPDLDLHFYGGRTIEQLTFTNVYLGGEAAWNAGDVRQIDTSLAAAMEDPQLNNVLAQYYADGKPTTSFRPSRFLDGPLPARVGRDTVEAFAASLDRENGLSGFDLTSSVFCFLLPSGIVLTDGTADSEHGLGGYHGSIHPKRGTATDTVYYAVGV